jgi:small GTP-binding protein
MGLMSQERHSFDEFVGGWGQTIRNAWDDLPDGARNELSRALSLLPGDLKSWRGLIDQAIDHFRLALGDKQQVAIVGPANAGKSTLYNQFVRSATDRAPVSAVPGTTRRSQEADAGLFAVIDTPGADAAGAVGEAERAKALASAEAADLLILLFDATHGIRQPEQELFRRLVELEKPIVVGLNKVDLVAHERGAVVGKAAAALGLSTEQVIPVSAKQGKGLERLLLAVAKSEPGITVALGAALPEYRWKLSQTVIGRAASTAAAIAVTPLPLADFIPLVVVQAAMVMSIARIYAYRITLRRARELIAAFGLGLLARSLFYELAKLGGPPGWLVSAGVAAGTTAGMGYAAAVWFERGERLSGEGLKRISRAVTEQVMDRLRGLGRKRPGRITLRQRVSEALEDLPQTNSEAPGGRP